jgi:hypothetical protein
VNDPRIREASVADLETSLLFLQWEENEWFGRWESMLGLVWTPEDLEQIARDEKTNQGEKSIKDLEAEAVVHDPNAPLRFPLSLLIRPELLQQLRERALPSKGGLFGMGHVPVDALSLSQVSKDDFLRKMGATPVQDRSLSSVDPLNASQRPQSGFAQGVPRRIGGK